MRGPRITALLLILALPRVAAAQPCCTGAASSEFGVVARGRIATIETQWSFDQAVATYTDRGEYVSLDEATANDLTLALGAGIRPLGADSRFQASAGLPLRYQYRALRGMNAASSYGVGDAALGVRADLLDDPTSGLPNLTPNLDVFTGVRAPTGRAPEDSDEPSGSDVTGDGAWEWYAGASLSKFVTAKNAAAAGVEYGRRFERRIEGRKGLPDRDYRPGDVVGLRAGWSFVPSRYFSVGAQTNLRMTYPSMEDGRTVEDSETLRWRFGASAVWFFASPYGEASAAFMTDPWWDGVGYNLPFAGRTYSLGLRRNFL